MFTFMQYLEHQILGEGLYRRYKVIKGFREEVIKEWAYAIHDKKDWVQPKFENLLQ